MFMLIQMMSTEIKSIIKRAHHQKSKIKWMKMITMKDNSQLSKGTNRMILMIITAIIIMIFLDLEDLPLKFKQK